MTEPAADALIRAAMEARRQAYAPYSDFRVGAALLASDGTVYTGCNVENASYGLTVCAERAAVSSAVSAGRRTFAAIAVAGAGNPAAYPCGACRQVLAEFCGPDLRIYVASTADPGAFASLTLGELLPLSFGFVPAERARP